ncbi:DUF572-domain-containing protein [Clavulina sp. PMI_390]|nr:DUF572-domain-containing protein [Clavulina sp. PMI_390]
MSERKVLNKYYPPDFDPSKIPRRSGPKNSQQVVRLMAPFSMRCNTCGEYIYKGKKFNARKETVEGEDYYGIKIFRFYIKCTLCSAEITFKTDPKNTDYAAEHGASRNFEPWREVEVLEEEDRLAKLEAEGDGAGDAMKTLENRQLDSKREMEILDALQDIRARNSRHERVGGDKALEALDARIELAELEEDEQKRLEQEEDDAIVAKYFSKIPDPSAPVLSTPGAGPSTSTSTSVAKPDDDGSASPKDDPDAPDTPATTLPPTPATSTITIKRKADFLEPDLDALRAEAAKAAMPKSVVAPPASKKKRADMASKLGIKVKPKVKT